MQPINIEGLDERIRRRAYEIWEESGRPEGMESQHWEQAAREIAASAVGQSSNEASDDTAATPQKPQAAQRAAKAVGVRQGLKSPPGSRNRMKPE
jgi:hypothetical protein